MNMDIIDRLSIDPGKRTLGELLQDREGAFHEIRRLRAQIEILRTSRTPKPPEPQTPQVAVQQSALRPKMLLRLTEVCEQLSVSRSTIYAWMAEGTFPPPVRISRRAVRWRVEEIEAWRGALQHSPWSQMDDTKVAEREPNSERAI